MPITIHNRARGLYQFDLILNGEKVHTLLTKESIVLPVPAGESKLLIKRSRRKAMSVTDGDTIIIKDWLPFGEDKPAMNILAFIGLMLLFGVATYFGLTALKTALTDHPDAYQTLKALLGPALVLIILIISRPVIEKK